MKKVYFLSTCSTCRRIMEKLNLDDFEQQDLKIDPITPMQIDEMKRMADSYEALFSRRAIKYKTMGLSDQSLSEKDYRRLILEEYTFLKRPVFIVNNDIYIGNSKKVVESLHAQIG